MRRTVRNIATIFTLLLCSVNSIYAQERPKLKELNAKKQEQAAAGILPAQKKEKWGFATHDGKYVIPPVFAKTLSVNSRQVAFVAYVKKSGQTVWTPIDLKGAYLTDMEFDSVVKDFDDRGLAVVMKSGKYGVINHEAKMVANLSYEYFKDKGPVYILYNKGSGCVAIAKDRTDKRYTTYSFAANEPIIVKAESGYGILSPRNYKLIASFKYDSVSELVYLHSYCLYKGTRKWLYSNDQLSADYDDIIPGPSKAYYVVLKNGLYGILTPSNTILLPCSQTEIPILNRDEYTRFIVDNQPVYLTWTECISASQYDDYLYAKLSSTPLDYLLEGTLDVCYKKYVQKALAKLYGTTDFAKLDGFQPAIEYAQSRKYILLSSETQTAKYLDENTGEIIESGEIIYHVFKSKNGGPAYATVNRSGKFGILDVRTKEQILPFVYDRAELLQNDYVLLHQGDTLTLYNPTENIMLPEKLEPLSQNRTFIDINCRVIGLQCDGVYRLYNTEEHRWLFPKDYKIERVSGYWCEAQVRTPENPNKLILCSIYDGKKVLDFEFDGLEWDGEFTRYVTLAPDKKGMCAMVTEDCWEFRIPCEFESISEDYYVTVSNGTDGGKETTELYIVRKDGKYGIYDAWKRKVVLETINDHVEINGQFALLTNGDECTMFSLLDNAAMFKFPNEKFAWLGEGYAFLKLNDEGQYGVYDLNNNKWQIGPFISDSPEFCFDPEYGENGCVFIPQIGLFDYLNNEWIVKEVPLYFERRGDWGWMAEWQGEVQYAYDLRTGECKASIAGGFDLIVREDVKGLSCDYLIVRPAGASALYPEDEDDVTEDTWDEIRANYKPDEWIPWNEVDGGAGLYNLDTKTWLFANVAGIERLDSGLLKIFKQNGECEIYDLVREKSLFKSSSGCYTTSFHKELNDFSEGTVSVGIIVVDKANNKRYLFDEKSREFGRIPNLFNYNDYEKMIQAYCKVSGSHDGWKVYDAKNKRYIPFVCNRISRMY